MKKKGVLIDVEKKEFRPVEHDGLQDMYRLIGCGTIDCVSLGESNGNRLVLIVDDEGLLKNKTKGMMLSGSSQPIMGNGLVVVENQEGETVDLEIEDGLLEKFVKFIEFDDPAQVPIPPIQIISWDGEVDNGDDEA